MVGMVQYGQGESGGHWAGHGKVARSVGTQSEVWVKGAGKC
jgi:hypothetical protein